MIFVSLICIIAMLANALGIDDTNYAGLCETTFLTALVSQATSHSPRISSEVNLCSCLVIASISVTQPTDEATLATPVPYVQAHDNVFHCDDKPRSMIQASLPRDRSTKDTSYCCISEENTETTARSCRDLTSLARYTPLWPLDMLESAGDGGPKVLGSSPKKEHACVSNGSDVCGNPDISLGNTSEAGRFMSFEEWRKQKKLELEAILAISEVSSASRSTQTLSQPQKAETLESSEVINDSPLAYEDQGRTYKDKFNYASVDCAATVVKTNSDAKGASAILTEVKDLYLINQCATPNKFIVVELCQDVLISSIVMGNFELFSSMFRTVRFSVSDRFPAVDGWHELGQFEAENRRDVQSFTIENPLIWSRYLKIEILSHYGNEFYCPLSILRVHGTNMMEDFKNTELTNKVELQASLTTEEFLNYTAEFDEECKVLSPYLAMNEFLKVFNSSLKFCEIKSNTSVTASGSTTTKATQESIFQNIIKRLSLLESNATLSLLYVEEQSKLLSDAFISLEERQVRKFESLLMQFHENIHSQVHFLDASLQRINEDSKKVLQTLKVFMSGAVKRIKTESAALELELTFLKKLVVIDTLIILSLLAYVVFRESLVADDLLKKENIAGRSPMKAFSVSKRKVQFKLKRRRL